MRSHIMFRSAYPQIWFNYLPNEGEMESFQKISHTDQKQLVYEKEIALNSNHLKRKNNDKLLGR